MKKIITSALFVFSVLTGLAQVPPHRTCGTMDYHNYLIQTRKNYEADFIQYNQMLDQYMKSPQFSAMRTTAATITIPVVIHVVYNTAAQNISDAQAISQFSVLDNDFNHLNADTVNIPSPFNAVAGKTGIRFCLAVRDPNGNPTTGIVHKSTTVTSFITDNKVKATSTGGDDPWDVTRYMNIWICPLGNSLLGYGEFPTGTISNTYGLVLNYTASGTMGTATAPFNKGRTGTHEFGHCFNLRHIWGDGGAQCAASDGITDTPPQQGGTANPPGCNYGSPIYPLNANTCTRPDGVAGANVTNTNGDMFMNFMDYTDDAAMNMFTKEQCLRMVAVVSTAPWNVLQSSNACTPVTSYSLDAGIASIIKPINAISTCINSVTPTVVLTNAGSSALTSAIVLYKMDAAATQTLNWTGSLATNANATLTLNAYTGLTSAVHTFSVWVIAPNGGVDLGSTNDSQSSTFTVTAAATGAALPFTEGFETTTFPPTGWVLQKANTISATNTWSRVANTTGLTAGSTAIALMDNFSGNTNIAGQLDALQSPALTFTSANTSLNLSFDVAHRVYNTTQIDTLNVYISSDCGTTWTRLYSKGGTQLANSTTAQTTAFTPTANTQWRRESVSLSSYVGLPSVYVKFESRSGYGNNVCLDNINISYTTTSTIPVANFSVSATKCVGSPITFTDLSTNAPTSWAWSFPGGTPSTSTSQNPSVTYTAAGTYTVTLLSANSSGTSTPITQTISINALPSVVATSATACAGNSAVLQATGASTYSWSSGVTTSTMSATPTTNTSYTVTGTATTGCKNIAVGTISVTSLPTVVSTSTAVCIGSSAVLTASGASTYSWSTGATTSTMLATPATNTSYTVTGTATTGCKNTAVGTITVNVLPTVVVTNTSVCLGSSAVLTASGASSYLWNTGATTSTMSATPTTNTSYTVTGTSTSGCTNTAVGSITVNALPTVAATSATTCAGNSALLQATGASTYSWSSGATTSTISVSPTTNSSYTVTGTATTGCKNTAVGSVTVNALPTVSVSSATICSGSAGTLTVSGASTYTWNTGATTSTISVTPTTNTSYTVTGTATTGCTNTAVGSVTVNALPTVSTSSTTICAGSAGTLTASGASTYVWNTGATGSNLIVSPASNTNYSVTGTSVAGCIKSATATIVVGSAPVITVNSPTICAGSTATLSASGVNSYTWSTSANTSVITVNPTGTTVYTVSGNLTGCSSTASQTATVTITSLPTVIATSTAVCAGNTAVLSASGASSYLWNTGAATSTISATPTTNTSYTVTGTSTTGCKNTAVGSVTVNALPTVVATNTSICAGSTAVLTASGASTYLWNTGSTTSTISVTPTTNTSYTVTGTSTTGCKNTVIGTVTVNALPTVVATNTTVCIGNLAVLTASGASSYIWNTGATTSTISATPTTNTSYTVTGTATTGCKNSAIGTVTVNALPTVVVTNTSVCIGSSAVLTASGASTYSWSTGATTSTISATPATNTSYTVTGTGTTGCKNTAIGTISVTSLPTIVATSTTVCVGGTAVLTASGASTYSWNTGATTSTMSTTPITNTSYTVTGTATTGCTNTAVGSVTVNTLPNVTVTSVTICSGATGTLIATGASTYVWNTGAAGSNLIVSPASNTNYTVTGTSVAGCVKSATATIVVGSAPVIAVNSSTICAGSTATLSANGVSSYTWNTSANTSAITVNPSSTTVYTVSGSLAGCTTTASQTATVTVNTLPAVSLSAISQLCTNSSPVVLMGSPSNGTYTGTGVSGSIFDPSISGAGTFTVMYYYTDANNCSGSASQPASVSLCTGIAEAFNASAIAIYPNPAKDIVYVNLNSSTIDNTSIELYDAIGKLVVSQKVVDAISTLIISDLAKGMYSIRIITDSHQVVKRIIKE